MKYIILFILFTPLSEKKLIKQDCNRIVINFRRIFDNGLHKTDFEENLENNRGVIKLFNMIMGNVSTVYGKLIMNEHIKKTGICNLKKKTLHSAQNN